MAKRTNNPAPHAGEQETPVIPADGETPGMGSAVEGAEDRPPAVGERVREDDKQGGVPQSDVEPGPEGQLPKPDLFKEGFPR